jgi:hypothetical protein
MKTLLSITLLFFSLISSAQHALGNYAPGGYYDQIELKKKAEQDLASKMYIKTIQAKERLAQGKSLSKSQQEALDWTEARDNKYNLAITKQKEEQLARIQADSIRVAEYNRQWEENANRKKQIEENYYQFGISYLENYKTKYRDYLSKCLKENSAKNLSRDDIKDELDIEFEKAYGVSAPSTDKFDSQTIWKVMSEVEFEFSHSKEYKDDEERKNSKLRAQLAELNKGQKEFNYNMTHLEKYTTPQLREMYIYFSDKTSFQTEAELVRIELLKRK